MYTPYKFGVSPITCVAFNKDRTQFALSPNNNEVHVYRVPTGGNSNFTPLQVLSEHTQRVTGIDWGPSSDRIVTCGADCNAYVWTREGDKWKPTLVILRINRAATCVKWSPAGNKFAVASGARLVAICYFENDHDWWVSKQLKKGIRSTALSIDWHPNNCLLAIGSADFKTRIFSAFVKDIEKRPGDNQWCTSKEMTFHNLVREYAHGNGGWIHDVSFSHDGSKLAWVAHDSTVTVVDGDRDPAAPILLRYDFLPFVSLTWISNGSMICVGHDCCPVVFTYDNGNLQCKERLEVKEDRGSGKGPSAMRKFRDIDRKNTSEDAGTQLDTVHLNTIRQVVITDGNKSSAGHVATVGVDGQVVFWDLKSLEKRFGQLRI